jgi:hypothetical protein
LSIVLRSLAENEGNANPQAELTQKYRAADGTKKRSGDTLMVRYGIETYATGN